MNKITINGVQLEYDSDFTSPDESFNGEVEITNVRLLNDNIDITEILSNEAMQQIKDEAWDLATGKTDLRY